MAELTWGTPLFFDLWAAGMAGGAYFAAFLFGLFGSDEDRRLLKLATYIGVPLVLLGVVAIIIDLGEPLRALNMYIGLRPYAWRVVPGSGPAALRFWPPSLTFRLVSPMSVGGWVLVGFSVSGIIMIALWVAEAIASHEQIGGLVGRVARLILPLAPVTGVLAWATFVFAILLMDYTGVVLAVSSRVLWSATFLLPALFLTSATLTGVAALMIAVRLQRGQAPAAMSRLRRALTTLIIMELAVMIGFVVWLSFLGAARPLVTGMHGVIFWLGAALLGLLVPLMLELRASGTGTMASGRLMLVSPTLVLLGGLLMRAVVVVAGQLGG